jgi:hypothetical protein
MRIDSNRDIRFYNDSGNVNLFWDASTMALGIGTGTTAPTNPITIQQTSVHWPYIALTNSSGVTKSQFGYQVNDDLLDIVANSGGIKFRTAGSERMRITSTGLVGINETAPQSGLHVKGSGSSSWITVENTLAGNYSIVDFLNNSGTRVGYIGTYNNDNALYFYGAQAGPIQFFTNNSEAMRIDSSGRVGIGTSSPNQLLTLGSSTANSTIGLDFETSNTIRGSILYDANAGELALTSGYSGYGGRIVFDANGSERMRIDSSGNLLVGKTTSGVSTDGFQAYAAGYATITDTSFSPLILNRKTSDGTILDLRKDGSTVGSIGNDGAILQMSSASTGGLFVADNGTNVFGFANGERPLPL